MLFRAQYSNTKATMLAHLLAKSGLLPMMHNWLWIEPMEEWFVLLRVKR